MFVMVAGRRQGKSVMALRWLMERPGDRFLIVASLQRKQHLLRLAVQTFPLLTDFKWLEQCIDTAVRLDHAGRGFVPRGAEIGIDDLDEVLGAIFNGRVELLTVNATLIPVATTSYVEGDFLERKGLEERKVLDDRPRFRPIRDNPQA